MGATTHHKNDPARTAIQAAVRELLASVYESNRQEERAVQIPGHPIDSVKVRVVKAVRVARKASAPRPPAQLTIEVTQVGQVHEKVTCFRRRCGTESEIVPGTQQFAVRASMEIAPTKADNHLNALATRFTSALLRKLHNFDGKSQVARRRRVARDTRREMVGEVVASTGQSPHAVTV